uniref:CCHC-type domain-containing protein n=1 Tax=Athene cunicularia TaxID=194338 RepID=A0A663M7X3_ATHCN
MASGLPRTSLGRLAHTSSCFCVTSATAGLLFTGLGESLAGEIKCVSNTGSPAEANASEGDKIQALMIQSSNYVKKPLGPPPPSRICFRWGKPGHYIKNCTTNGDSKLESAPRLKKSTGIPRSFMVEVEDPSAEGAMLTQSGRYLPIPCVKEAYARGKKEKPPFLPEEPSSSSLSSSSDDPIPGELLCFICKEIMAEAIVIPCIRGASLDSEAHTRPACHRAGVSPDTLVANKCLHQVLR